MSSPDLFFFNGGLSVLVPRNFHVNFRTSFSVSARGESEV